MSKMQSEIVYVPVIITYESPEGRERVIKQISERSFGSLSGDNKGETFSYKIDGLNPAEILTADKFTRK